MNITRSKQIPICPKCGEELKTINETSTKLTNEKNVEFLSCAKCNVFLGIVNQYKSIV